MIVLPISIDTRSDVHAHSEAERHSMTMYCKAMLCVLLIGGTSIRIYWSCNRIATCMPVMAPSTCSNLVVGVTLSYQLFVRKLKLSSSNVVLNRSALEFQASNAVSPGT